MVQSLTPELPTSQMVIPKLDWTLLREDADVRSRFTLTTARGVRRIVCPQTQAAVVQDVLMGREYPLPLPIMALVEGMPIVDIGAHVGAANVYFDEALRPSQIASFEPHPQAQGYLQANANGTTTIHPEAVTNHRRGATLHTPASSLEHLEWGEMLCCASIQDVDRFPGMSDHPVPTITGAEALQKVSGPIGILKIDAELSELDILSSAAGELDRVQVIFLEYHKDLLRRGCDALLQQFEIFFTEGHLRQGVIGYINKSITKEFPGHLHF